LAFAAGASESAAPVSPAESLCAGLREASGGAEGAAAEGTGAEGAGEGLAGGALCAAAVGAAVMSEDLPLTGEGFGTGGCAPPAAASGLAGFVFPELGVAGPEFAELAPEELGLAEPEPAEPEVVEPEVVEPEFVEPEFVELGFSELEFGASGVLPESVPLGADSTAAGFF